MARSKRAKKKTATGKAASKAKPKAKVSKKGTSKADPAEESDAGDTSWEVDDLGLTPEKLEKSVTYHETIFAIVGEEKVKFARGEKIWVAPGPESSNPRKSKQKVENIEEVPDELWNVAEILDCCCLKGEDGTTLGFLRVKWYYRLEECLALPTLHGGFKKKLKEYKFDEDERVVTDHVDFISLEVYSGNAEGIWCYVSIKGLEVSDEDRLKPPEERIVPHKKVEATGFSLKAKAVAKERLLAMEQAARLLQAEKAKKKKAKKAK